MEKKICKKCSIEKDLNDFYYNKRSSDKRMTYCIICQKEYKKNNKEKIKERKKEWDINNKEKILDSLLNLTLIKVT